MIHWLTKCKPTFNDTVGRFSNLHCSDLDLNTQKTASGDLLQKMCQQRPLKLKKGHKAENFRGRLLVIFSTRNTPSGKLGNEFEAVTVTIIIPWSDIGWAHFYCYDSIREIKACCQHGTKFCHKGTGADIFRLNAIRQILLYLPFFFLFGPNDVNLVRLERYFLCGPKNRNWKSLWSLASLSLSFAFSLSLSLSLTHTHTHTHTQRFPFTHFLQLYLEPLKWLHTSWTLTSSSWKAKRPLNNPMVVF